ncbi:MAG: phosphotransferase [Desulfobacterales bacterium]|nr:phosphotransferase [Desulfobacterales bacterium]
MKLKTIVNLGRLKEILTTFVKYGFADVIRLLDLPGHHLANRFMDVDPDLTPYERFRMALDQLGPTFVKFGQVMSLRSDLLPKPLIEELQKLQDDAAPVDIELIKAVICDNLDQPWERLFLSFDEQPLAAASLSQVHRAVLQECGTEVALKVQRPDIESKINRDLSILDTIAERMHQRIPEMQIYELPRLVKLTRKSLERELDFSREARSIQIARSYMRGMEGIHVPKAFLKLSTPQLLVMEFVHGQSLRTINHDLLEDPAVLARNGLKATVRQLFEVGFFHADLHPGNVLISNGNTINLIDWGMIGRLTARDRYEVVGLISAIVEKDSRRLVDTLLAITSGHTEIDRRALERDLLGVLDSYLVDSLSDLRLGQLVLDVAEMIRQYHLQIPPDLFMMIKALVAAEGTVQLIDPDMDLVAEMRPHLKRLATQRFRPESILRSARAFLFKIAAAPTQLPRRIVDIVEKMERGNLRIGFEHRNLGGLQNTLEKIFSRLTMGIILGAMVIGSSLIITTGIPPIFYGYPLLGLAGYLISAVLGLWLIFDILHNR